MIKKLLKGTQFEEIYENIQDRYKGYLSMECSDKEIGVLIDKYINSLGSDNSTRIICKLIFATIQWDFGRLDTEKIRELFDLINDLSESHSLAKEQEDALKYYTKVLYDPQPKRRIIKKPREIRVAWKLGDFLTLKIVEEKGWTNFAYPGRYVLIQVTKIKKESSVRFDTKHYDEIIFFRLCDWISDFPATSKDITDPAFIPLVDSADKILGRCDFGRIGFSKKDLVTFKIQVVKSNEPINDFYETGDDLSQHLWLHNRNFLTTIEWALLKYGECSKYYK